MKYLVSKECITNRKKFFLQKCKENGLRCTPQKEKIYETLAMRNDHPTAQQIFEVIKKSFPSLSFATVYKNLSLFVEKKMIQILDFGEGVSRFDAELSYHSHIYNTETKETIDVWTEKIPKSFYPSGISPEQVKKIDITYYI